MNYEKTGLRLDIDNNKDREFNTIFSITEERAKFLDKKVLMAKQIIGIEHDMVKGIDYFMSECLHPNEAAYCWLRLGQKCDCSMMAKVSVLGGSSGIGGLLDLLSKMEKGNPGRSDDSED